MYTNNDKPTNHDKPKLNDEKVLSQAKKTLEIFLPLEADGYCVTNDTLYDILIGTAANRGTTESVCAELAGAPDPDRKSTRLNSSHVRISYAVFCLKKK